MSRLFNFKNPANVLRIKSDPLLILLDYDGTIVPIAPRPEAAILPEKTKELVTGLNRLPDVCVGIISGRTLSDLRNMVGIDGIIYAGNHGIEWEIKGERGKLKTIEKGEESLAKIKKELNVISRKFRGAILEDKQYILSIHYRLVKKELLEPFGRYLKYLIAPYKKSGKIAVTRGKKVYEIKLDLDWNKGEFVKFLTEKHFQKRRPLLIYMGDDVTDEDVFVKYEKAITVKVGQSPSRAKFYLKNQKEVIPFLENIYSLRRRIKY